MALRLRHWIFLVVAGAAFLAAWALPPGSRSRFPTAERSPAATALRSLAAASGRLTRLRRADSVEARLTAAPGGVAAAVWGDPGVSEGALRERVAEEVAALPRRSDVRVGAFAAPRTFLEAEARIPVGRRVEYYRGSVDGHAYCATLRTDDGIDLGSPRDWWGRAPGAAPDDVLGACAFLAAYGEPGAGVNAWLGRGGYALGGLRLGKERAGAGDPEDAPRRLATLDACLVDGGQACRILVLGRGTADPTAASHAATPVVGNAQVPSPELGFFGSRFLADLEAAMGPDRFARFWASPDPMPEAFEGAFGVPLETWVHGWLLRRFEPVRAGTALGGGEASSILLWIALAFTAAAAVQRRRRIG